MPQVKIQKIAGQPCKIWHCDRCKTELVIPVENTSVYVYDTKKRKERLICVDCVKATDLYIWGNRVVL